MLWVRVRGQGVAVRELQAGCNGAVGRFNDDFGMVTKLWVIKVGRRVGVARFYGDFGRRVC